MTFHNSYYEIIVNIYNFHVNSGTTFPNPTIERVMELITFMCYTIGTNSPWLSEISIVRTNSYQMMKKQIIQEMHYFEIEQILNNTCIICQTIELKNNVFTNCLNYLVKAYTRNPTVTTIRMQLNRYFSLDDYVDTERKIMFDNKFFERLKYASYAVCSNLQTVDELNLVLVKECVFWLGYEVYKKYNVPYNCTNVHNNTVNYQSLLNNNCYYERMINELLLCRIVKYDERTNIIKKILTHAVGLCTRIKEHCDKPLITERLLLQDNNVKPLNVGKHHILLQDNYCTEIVNGDRDSVLKEKQIIKQANGGTSTNDGTSTILCTSTNGGTSTNNCTSTKDSTSTTQCTSTIQMTGTNDSTTSTTLCTDTDKFTNECVNTNTVVMFAFMYGAEKENMSEQDKYTNTLHNYSSHCSVTSTQMVHHSTPDSDKKRLKKKIKHAKVQQLHDKINKLTNVQYQYVRKIKRLKTMIEIQDTNAKIDVLNRTILKYKKVII